MRTMIRDGEAFCSRSHQSADLARQAKLDRIDHTTLTGSIRTGDGVSRLTEIDIELTNSPNFFDVCRFDLDHVTTPWSDEKIFTRSSALILEFSVSSLRSASIFASSKDLLEARS